MSFTTSLNIGAFYWVAWAVYGAVLLFALTQVPWRILLHEKGLQHLFLGGVVLVVFMWQMRAGINQQVALHLILATTLTLMFYWPMALIALSLALVSTIYTGKSTWAMFPVNALIVCVVPVFISHWVWRFVDTKLPDNYFVFVFVAGGLGSVLSSLGVGLAVVLVSWNFASAYEFYQFSTNYFMFLPLTLPPEAVINGMILSGLTAYMPDWVRSFDPKRYIDKL